MAAGTECVVVGILGENFNSSIKCIRQLGRNHQVDSGTANTGGRNWSLGQLYDVIKRDSNTSTRTGSTSSSKAVEPHDYL